MKELKDYLPFYLGCEVTRWFRGNEIRSILTSSNLSGFEIEHKRIKLILRQVSNISDEEAIELFKMLSLYDLEDCVFDFIEDESSFCINAESNGIVIDAIEVRVSDFPIISMMNNDGSFSPVNNIQDVFMFLLSKHFDLFGLIEASLAIDATTLKQKF